MTEKFVQGGWLPDPPKKPGEEPDWNFCKSLCYKEPFAVPEEFTIRGSVTSVLDQLNLGSCVVNSGFQAIRMRQALQGLLPTNSLSLGARLWGYYLARSYTGMENWDSGTHIRDFFRALNKYGFLPESQYKYGYDVSKFYKPPPPVAYRRAFDQRSPTGYWRIYDVGGERLRQIKQAIYNLSPVVFGTQVTKEFLNLDGSTARTNIIDKPKPDDAIAGGHAMCITGYTPDGFEVVNSWGENWGESGFFRMSNDYMMWEETQDLWMVEKVPYYS